MRRNLKRTLFAVSAGVMGILTMTGLFAWMMLQELIDPGHLDLMAAGALIIGSGIAAFVCGKGEGRCIRVLGAEGGLILFLSMVNLCLFDGNYLERLIPCTMLSVGTGFAVILADSGKGRRGKGKGGEKKSSDGQVEQKIRQVNKIYLLEDKAKEILQKLDLVAICQSAPLYLGE